MGRPRIRLHSLCIGHATHRVRACSSSSFGSKSSSASIKYENRTEFSSNDSDSDKGDKVAKNGNKIMVVADSGVEAKGALEWALSHAVQTQDTVVLVHVARPTKAESSGKFNLNNYQHLLDMKSMCAMKRPGVHVNVVIVEGEEKGPAIVEEAKQQRVSLLVVGHRKRPMLWCLMKRWTRKRRRRRRGVVEYCIQNAPCMSIAVRRKNKKLGGYLITTKRLKNFWLLA